MKVPKEKKNKLSKRELVIIVVAAIIAFAISFAVFFHISYNHFSEQTLEETRIVMKYTTISLL